MPHRATPNTAPGHRQVLIVGNKAQELLFLSLTLQRFHYTTVMAHTAAQALERINVSSPALILCDLVLPGMNGIDLFHLLRQDRRTASIPLVFMIPMSDAAAERRCMDIGAAACITKPVLAEGLYQTVQAVIEPRPRTNIRIEIRLPVSVDNVPLPCAAGACDVDLSEQGMYVPMDRPLPKHKRVSVAFPIRNRVISAEGSVLYCCPAHGQSRREPGVGLKFTRIDPQDQEFIKAFIREEVTRNVRAALSQTAFPLS
jgi:twitching motility two-component system response regulator PilH